MKYIYKRLYIEDGNCKEEQFFECEASDITEADKQMFAKFGFTFKDKVATCFPQKQPTAWIFTWSPDWKAKN